MKHRFRSPDPDLSGQTVLLPDGSSVDGDVLVDGPKWNDVHVVGTREVSADDVLTADDDFVEATGGVDGITLTLLDPTLGVVSDDDGVVGYRKVKIMKVDDGDGAVTLDGTVNGNADGYALANQWQYVELQVRVDQSGYIVVDNN